MKKLAIITLVSVSFSISAVIAASTPVATDLNQIFSGQGKVASLSPQEMQQTEGRYSLLSALLDFADDYDGIDADGDGRDTDFTSGDADGDGRDDDFDGIDSDGDGRDSDRSGVGASGGDFNNDGIDDGLGDLARYFSPESWNAIVAGLTNGSFRADPTGFLVNLGIDPNFVVSASNFNNGGFGDDRDGDDDRYGNDRDGDDDRYGDRDNDRDGNDDRY